MIWGWGGGGLKSYVDAGQVEDLTDWFGQNAAVKDKLFPSSFGAGHGRTARSTRCRCETVQPIVLYYNKKVFDQVGVQPPQSWDDIMAPGAEVQRDGHRAVLARRPVPLDQHDVAGVPARPASAAPRCSTDVFAGKTDAWSDPAVLDMLTKVQDLVKANGFIKGFSSITADSNADQALLYTGKAAMMLHGAWSYGIQKAEGGDFVAERRPRLHELPADRGRQGRPEQHRRQPRPVPVDLRPRRPPRQKEIAKKFFSTTARRRPGGRRAGSSPAACRSSRAATASSAVARTPSSSSSSTTPSASAKVVRPVLGPGAEPDRGRDAAGQHRQAVPAADHPAAVGRQHERGHRQMTTLAPPVVRCRSPPVRPAGGAAPSPGWSLPALLIFVGVRRRPAGRRARAELHHLGRHRRRSTRPA